MFGSIAQFTSKLFSVLQMSGSKVCGGKASFYRSSNSDNIRHRINYVVQLMVELVLFVSALFSGEYVHTIAFAIGMCAALVAILASEFKRHVYKMSAYIVGFTILWLSLIMGLFVFGIEISALKSDGERVTTFMLNIFFFGIIPALFRLNSIIHSRMQYKIEMWFWLQSKLDKIGISGAYRSKKNQFSYDSINSDPQGETEHRKKDGTRFKKSIAYTVYSVILVVLCIICVTVVLIPRSEDYYSSINTVNIIN